MITLPTPYQLLLHQVSHYAGRLANARSIKERMWLRREHYNFKQRFLQTYLN